MLAGELEFSVADPDNLGMCYDDDDRCSVNVARQCMKENLSYTLT